MKTCIGIISYFPNPEKTRAKRITLCNECLESCRETFEDVPIMIISQNWGNDFDTIDTTNCIVHNYTDKLGIPQAREILREKFLESEFDRLIMLDDDCIVAGEGKEYIEILDKHPNDIHVVFGSQLKLFSISRELYSKIHMASCDPEKNEGVEDVVFSKMVELAFPGRVHKIPQSKCPVSMNLQQTFKVSTWRSRYIDNFKLIRNTENAVKDLANVNWDLE